ncbi:hypothetical protein R7Q39_18940 [Vibrio sp. 947]|uniref:hypothetical protein n=1 Tax=Vibrio TaxID=662 RepID=UPI0029643B95|nr:MULTISPECIES: hypothetical protein [unclassified Vibrio]MDW1583833.1 hypothetical protein [Vibrio sp. Vb2897]MDW1642104.1 hypothetical protein [Vibrio sp. Vb2896]MDW1927507.1 hypothetical protein [Vibrio sp. 947]
MLNSTLQINQLVIDPMITSLDISLEAVKLKANSFANGVTPEAQIDVRESSNGLFHVESGIVDVLAMFLANFGGQKFESVNVNILPAESAEDLALKQSIYDNREVSESEKIVDSYNSMTKLKENGFNIEQISEKMGIAKPILKSIEALDKATKQEWELIRFGLVSPIATISSKRA